MRPHTHTLNVGVCTTHSVLHAHNYTLRRFHIQKAFEEELHTAIEMRGEVTLFATMGPWGHRALLRLHLAVGLGAPDYTLYTHTLIVSPLWR